MRILCICPIGIGNYLLCYPSWYLIKKVHPEAELHLLALRKPILDLAQHDPLWSALHLIEPVKKPSMGSIAGFIRQLSRLRFSASIASFPANTWQYNLLPFLAGIKRRYAFSYPLKKHASLSWLATDRVPVDGSLHDVEQNIVLAGALLDKNLSAETVTFPELITDDDVAFTDDYLGKGTYFAIHSGSSIEHGMDAKRWAPERFGAIADLISKKTGATALILGGNDETSLKTATAAAMTTPYRIVDQLSLKRTAALLNRCKLCICNDSGIMHLAACGGTPVIALFGPTDEKRNGPFGDKHLVIRKDLPGFPLWNALNVGVRNLPPLVNPNEPLLSLSVEEVWEKVSIFIQNLPE